MAQSLARVRVYDSAGPRESWAAMARDLWAARELTWRLLVRDFSARHRQSVLGIAWALLPAIANAALFTWLRSARVLTPGETGVAYPAYVLLGMASWQIFHGGLTAAAQSLSSAGNLVSRVSFPRESLVLASVLGTLPDAAIRAALVAGVFAFYGIAPAWTVVLAPLVWLPLLLLVAGAGFLLALGNALVRDAGHALNLFLALFFFLVPIVAPPPAQGLASRLIDWNPVAALVLTVHDLVLVGHPTRPAAFAGACVVSALVFLAGWRAFRTAQPLLAERL